MTQAEAARLTIEGMVAHYRSGDLTLLPGALEAVRRTGAAYPIAIASSSPRILIDTFVEAMGLGDLLRVTVSTEDRDNFVKNMVTILCEERVGLSVYRPEAFVKGDFDGLPATA